MPNPGTLRLATIVAGLTEDERSQLVAALTGHPAGDDGGMDDEVLTAHLSDPSGIRARADRLDPELRERLDELVYEITFFATDAEDVEPLQVLMRAGLALPTHEEGLDDAWIVPLEVRAALLDEDGIAEADLALLLLQLGDEELDGLAQLHDVSDEDIEDGMELAVRIAEQLLDSSRLQEIHASLQPASASLLLWLFQHDAPVPRAAVEERATQFEEGRGAGERVLVRLGLVHEVELAGTQMLMIPRDLRYELAPLLSDHFNQQCSAAWMLLKQDGVPSFRDVFPRGYGGNSVVSARYRLARALYLGPDEHDPMDLLLAEFFVYDPDTLQSGELAAYHLDVSGPDAFARNVLRIWSSSLEDIYTRRMIAAFGGDAGRICAWLRARLTPGDEPSFEYQVWTEALTQLRSQLLMALSVLPPGHWYPVERLAQLLVALYRRTIWQYGRFHLFADDFPRDALPDGTQDLTPARGDDILAMCSWLLGNLFEPLGATQPDGSGQLFMVNTEAFRTVRDRDGGFDAVWDAAEAVLNEDADLWLPMPVDVGVRSGGLAPLRWDDDDLLLPLDAHVHDLNRLAQWAQPVMEGQELRLLFDAETLREDAAANELEELLLWLRARTGAELPSGFRSLVPLVTCTADGSPEQVHQAARARAAAALETVETWAETPALSVMEDLRSWGTAAGEVVLERLGALLAEGDRRDPVLRHLAVLCGELCLVDAVPDLTRLLIEASDESLEGAAAMALARIGEPSMRGLVRLVQHAPADINKRLAAHATLSSLAVLHPHLATRVIAEMRRFLRDEEIGEEATTIAAVHLAETGHPEAEQQVLQIKEQGRWLDEVVPFDEVMWLIGFAPSVWGHPMYANPIAQVFPNGWESDELVRIAGIDELMAESGVDRDEVLGDARRWKRNDG